MRTQYRALWSQLQRGQDTAMVTNYRETGIEKILLDTALPSSLRLDKEADGYSLAEPFVPPSRLIVLGGGHVALPLVRFAAASGFSVTVCDDRPTFANKARFPEASVVVCDDFDHALANLNVNSQDYVVIVTRGHRHDTVCLRRILSGTTPYYIGMIGSKRRVSVVRDLLAKEGIDAQRLTRVSSPIGLPIGAVTPEEIAVSILAEIISCKRLGTHTMRDIPEDSIARTDYDFEVLAWLAANDTPAAMATVTACKGSAPRQAGAKMLVLPDGRIIGSIGGGCAEAAVILSARELIGTGKYVLETVDLTDAAENEGMVCGGVMDVLLEDIAD